jgi:hypothetical protein
MALAQGYLPSMSTPTYKSWWAWIGCQKSMGANNGEGHRCPYQPYGGLS